MTLLDEAGLARALDLLPSRFKGPGGVAGVVRDGQVIARRAWGYADLTRRLPMSAQTRLPICSISKQFTCALLLDQITDPEALDPRVAGALPQFRGPLPTIRQLCDNQSGLRDYWALTVLQGAVPEGRFGREDAAPLIARMKTGHFPPGSAYSYSNGNFRILADLIEAETGRPLDALYAERLFAPAGMHSATLAADTSQPLGGVTGYEGNDTTGFLPAANGIYWTGDAGISAALDDMLAWECHIDATRDDAGSLYRRLSVQPYFADGRPASYGYGLKHETIAGVAVTGHGGALRGFRAQRFHVAEKRLSVVVMFNHEASAHDAGAALLEAALGSSPAETPTVPAGWEGQWLDPDQGLVLRLTPEATGLTLRYATGPVRLTLAPDGTAQAPGLRLHRAGDRLIMQRSAENLAVTARPLPPVTLADGPEIAGRYWSEELEAHLLIDARDGAIFAGFDGLLGAGPMERMYPVGADVWVISTRRSMDAAAPGDWTVCIQRDAAGGIAGLTLGCWLARNIAYQRIG